MKYFAEVHTLDELKKEFRRLAMLHHPDVGGDTATMQEINAEYDRLFPALKLAYNRAAEQPTHETAESTRSEFYTQNGWKGSRYDSHMSTKDISIKIREYVKSAYPDCKFSITTHYASMCSEISVALTAAPYEALKPENIDYGKGYRQINYYYVEKDEALTDYAKAVLSDVNDMIKSYRYDDSDGMIDYFDTNFYYSLDVGRWNKPFIVNSKQPKIKAPEPEQPSNTAQNRAAPLRVEINSEHNGIEVYFPGKPDGKTRAALKSQGWRWHKQKQCWYNRNTEENLQGLKEIAG
jgi:curved DNA-binding protein CbpA